MPSDYAASPADWRPKRTAPIAQLGMIAREPQSVYYRLRPETRGARRQAQRSVTNNDSGAILKNAEQISDGF
jgi:hypothetical protein